MRRRLLITLLLALLAIPCAAVAERFPVGKEVEVSFGGQFAPRSLPRVGRSPISVEIEGKIATADGSKPPPLRRLEIALNRNGSISTQGLATCRGSQLQSTSRRLALARCRPALVGRGSFHTTYELGGDVPSDGTILIFNSRHHGEPALLLHLSISIPVQATLVLPLTLRRLDEGEFGTVLEGNIPKLAGGLGSITRLKLHVGRVYSFRGHRRGYISAGCPAPAGLGAAVFRFLRGRFTFENNRSGQVTLVRSCEVR
jgi:hypothetical protein